MNSTLMITSAESLQQGIIRILNSRPNKRISPCIYISLSKPARRMAALFRKQGISRQVFVIDCISGSESSSAIHVPPDRLDLLLHSIKTFLSLIDRPLIVIDSLGTLLIYNHENAVAAFVKETTDLAIDAELIALTPKTKEDLLHKIYNFFDEVKK